jgi:hypothetical protein
VLFAEATHILSQPFKHQENIYDEYKDQVLLPHMLTKSGPFIATGDVNSDGTEDFIRAGQRTRQEVYTCKLATSW